MLNADLRLSTTHTEYVYSNTLALKDAKLLPLKVYMEKYPWYGGAEMKTLSPDAIKHVKKSADIIF